MSCWIIQPNRPAAHVLRASNAARQAVIRTNRQRRYIGGMSNYQIMPNKDNAGFDVEVITAIGVRHLMLGFASEKDAEAWIVADRARDAMS
jgi:hypothetical protein